MKIKLSELRQIVKSIIKEQGGIGSTIGKVGAAAVKQITPPNIIGKQMRLYLDEANTDDLLVVTIKGIKKNKSFIEITVKELDGFFSLGCTKGIDHMNYYFQSKSASDIPVWKGSKHYHPLQLATLRDSKLYNKAFTQELKNIYCTTSAGGTGVTNIGKYSSTTSNAPVNVAEIRKIVKSIIRDEM